MVHKAQDEWQAAAETLLPLVEADLTEPLATSVAFHYADSLRRDGRAAAAKPIFDRILTHHPPDKWADDALLGKLHLAAAGADHEEVDRLSRQFLTDHAQSELRREVLQLQVRSQLDRKLHSLVVALLEPLVAELDPPVRASSERYLLALAYLGLERFADAESVLAPLDENSSSELQGNIDLARGSALVGQRRYADALKPLMHCWQLAPQGDSAARCLAQWAICLAQTGDFEEARRRYDTLVSEFPEHALIASTTLHLAEAAYAAHQRQWSAELFARLNHDEHPADVAARGISGVAWNLFKQGELIEAATRFQTLLDRYPEQPVAAEAALARGQILERLDQPDAALAMYHLVIERYADRPSLPQALLHAARLHERLHQRDEALDYYARLADDFTDLPEADSVLYEWAWSLREAGKSAESAQAFARLRREHPHSRYLPEATYRLAEAAFKARDLTTAESLVAEVLQIEPHTAVREHAFYLQAQLGIHRQQWVDAVAPLQALCAEFPQGKLRYLSQYWQAEAEYRQAHYEAAAQKLDELIPLLPQPPEPWMAIVFLRRAQTHAQADQWDAAQKLAESLARNFSAFDQQYEVDYLLGRCHARQADFARAREAYRRVVESEQGGETETAAMAQWMVGETYFHQKEYSTAIREYLRVEVLYAYPTWQAAALLQAGKCYERLERWQEAAEAFGRVVSEFEQTQFVDEAARRLRTAEARVGTHKS